MDVLSPGRARFTNAAPSDRSVHIVAVDEGRSHPVRESVVLRAGEVVGVTLD